jgi:hypothetical protein
MYNIISLFSLVFSCYLILRILQVEGISEKVIFLFSILTAQIIVFGYILSFINHLSDLRYWTILSLISLLISATAYILVRKKAPYVGFSSFRFDLIHHFVKYIKNWFKEELSRFEKIVLSLLIFTTLLLGILNLIIIIFTAPQNWDSMTYHLARVAYYLQHNNLNYYPANYWAQVVHPKNSSILLLYTYLISGRNENLTQLVQYISYWVAVCGVYGISRKVGNSIPQSIFTATVSALLIEWLLQATTTQNDLILTAYFGVIVYALFTFRETQKYKYLVFAALGIGLSIGTKASAYLPLISVVLIAFYTIISIRVSMKHRLHIFSFLGGCTLLAIALFALPSGYAENYRTFGNPIGPQYIRKLHSFEGETTDYIIQNGSKNLIRFGFDFLSIDGIPPFYRVQQVQSLLRAAPIFLLHNLGIDLEAPEATRASFSLIRTPKAHEDDSYWGVLGFGLVWVMVVLSLIGVIKSPDTRVLSLASLLFLGSQALAGPYDPWRGRYFAICAIFAVPTVGRALQSRKLIIRGYLIFIILLGCLSGASAIVFRSDGALISIRYQGISTSSIFSMNRIEQLARSRPVYYEALQMFDKLVPEKAVIAVFLSEDSYEYPLFGEHLTRTLIPIHSFKRGLLPIPHYAEYLIYDQNYPCPSPNDISLGENLYVRELTKDNRRCGYK